MCIRDRWYQRRVHGEQLTIKQINKALTIQSMTRGKFTHNQTAIVNAINKAKEEAVSKKRHCPNDPTTCPFCISLISEREVHNRIFSFVDAAIARFVQDNWFTNKIEVENFMNELRHFTENPVEVGPQFKNFCTTKTDLQLMESYVNHIKLPFSAKNVRNQRYHAYLKRLASRDGEEVFARDYKKPCKRKGLKGTYKNFDLSKRQMVDDDFDQVDFDVSLIKGLRLRGFNEPAWKMVRQ
eukprot:TRINITY_DN5189_c0_g2_i4.p1 TRINITY_DN5189_c0_g2~~TRINITY_DN5189_c0_g2_i4.p1  ORF type:complete len:264 (+),score=64.40 TRINITY_DN5189_c0_g2_i4:77-793(+)